jgi:major type 1 subunit fimbrin (pilin)
MLEMKRSLPIALALSMALGLAATAASASNTITIEGGVTTTTCDVSGGQGLNGNDGGDFTVVLPTLSANQFTAAGDTAGKVPFTINLSNCTVGDSDSVTAYFHPTLADVDTTAGTLINKSGAVTTTNIEVQLLDGQKGDASINLAGYNPADMGRVDIDAATKKAQLLYWAQYRAPVAAITPGEYSSSLQYDIDYQ